MIALEKFLEMVEYTPKSIGDEVDGKIEVRFRDYRGYSAKIDFGTVPGENGKQTFWFEILGPAKPGTENERRKVLVLRMKIGESTAKRAAERVNDGLSKMYRRV